MLEIFLPQKIQKYKISPAKKAGPSSFRVSRRARLPLRKNRRYGDGKGRRSEGSCEKNDRKAFGVESDWRSTKNSKSRARSKLLFAQKKERQRKVIRPTGKKGRVRPLFLSRHDGRFDSSFLETITVTQEWREKDMKAHIYI